MIKSITLFCLFVSLFAQTRAATFNVTPNLVSNDYTGPITFQISGLSPGEAVQIVQFYDYNGNGIVDGKDFGVRGDLVIDGQAALLGGATNVNVLQDQDGAANGAIRASFPFGQEPDLARGIGSYVFLFSSPSNHFQAFAVPFTVVSAPYPQQVQGVVKSNGTNVPYAGVALVQNVNGNTKVIVGSSSDAAGNYTLKGLPDSYAVVAFRPGYVSDLSAAPMVSLSPNATVTTNLNLIAATTLLAGRLVDNDNPSLPALPYSQITVFDSTPMFTVSVTDSNANFLVPVTAGSWTVRSSWQSAVARSYIAPQPGSFTEPSFNTASGPVLNAAVAVKRATALIYGQVLDNHSNAIYGITLSASADGGAFAAYGLSDTNGSYSLGIDAGGGYVNVQDLTSAPANKYLWSGDSFSIGAGQAVKINVIGIVSTAHFRGQLLDDTGAPIGQFGFYANRNLGGTSLTVTGTNGVFDLPVAGGSWQLYPDYGEPEQRNLIFPPYSFQIADGANYTNNIIVRKAAGVISGNVRNQTGTNISYLSVTYTATAGSNNYSLSAYTDANGNFSLGVFNGTWTVSLSPYDLLSLGYNPVNPVNVTVPPPNGTANFVLIPIGAAVGSPAITTTSLPEAYAGQPYYQSLMVTNAAQPFSWSIASGALPNELSLDPTTGAILGTPTNTGVFNFTAQLDDANGSNTTRVLSLNIRAARPAAPSLDMPAKLAGNTFTMRASGVTGQSYTLQASTTLETWTDVLTTNAPSNVFYLQEPRATNSTRFYRLKVNP